MIPVRASARRTAPEPWAQRWDLFLGLLARLLGFGALLAPFALIALGALGRL